ncbi:hypothetical protein ACOME3_003705 [Neoechinorhynchus agilis]
MQPRESTMPPDTTIPIGTEQERPKSRIFGLCKGLNPAPLLMSILPGRSRKNRSRVNRGTTSSVVNTVVANDQAGLFESHSRLNRRLQINRFWLVGVAIICMGGLSFLLQILSIITKATAYRIGAGVWCGSFFVVTGFLTALTGTRNAAGPTLPHLLFWVFFSASICCPVLLRETKRFLIVSEQTIRNRSAIMVALYGIAADLVKSRSLILTATTHQKSNLGRTCKQYSTSHSNGVVMLCSGGVTGFGDADNSPGTFLIGSPNVDPNYIWPAIIVNFLLLVVDFVTFILQLWVAIGACKLLTTPRSDSNQYYQLRRRARSSFEDYRPSIDYDYPPPQYSDLYFSNSSPLRPQQTQTGNHSSQAIDVQNQ